MTIYLVSFSNFY